MEQCLSAIQPLGEEGREAACLCRTSRARSGVGHARCLDHSSSPSCGRRLNKSRDQQLGRSRGGFGTKIQAACDGLGNPVKFRLTRGQTRDITQAAPRFDGLVAEQVVADKGYDGDTVL